MGHWDKEVCGLACKWEPPNEWPRKFYEARTISDWAPTLGKTPVGKASTVGKPTFSVEGKTSNPKIPEGNIAKTWIATALLPPFGL